MSSPYPDQGDAKAPLPMIFLSYAREDAEAAQRLCRDLRSHCRTVWFDQDSILPGERWRLAVARAIKEADYFLALLSDVSVGKRGTVQAEIKWALEVLEELPEDKVYLIPARLEPCEPSSPRIRELQWVDLFPAWDDGLRRILMATESDLSGPDDDGPPIPFTSLQQAAIHASPVGSVRLADIVNDAVERLVPYARQRGLELRVRNEAPGLRLTTTSAFLREALANVIHNAIKYSYTGRTVSSMVEVLSRSGPRFAEVEVTNLGLGLESDGLAYIFERGFRGRSAVEREEGAGVGLWIAREFLREGKGEITIESRPLREGHAGSRPPYLTRVTIRLPMEAEG